MGVCFDLTDMWYTVTVNEKNDHTSHLCFMVPHADAAIVQAGQHPRLGGMEVDALDPVRPGRELPLDVQPQRL